MDQLSTTQQTNQNHSLIKQTILTATFLITVATPALTITTDTIMETTMAILIHQ